MLERSAVAMLEILQKGFETEPAGDAGFDFGELFGGEFFPARPDGGLVAEAVEEELDFREGEAHFSGETDEEDAVESFRGIAALAAGAMRGSEEAEFFVVADGRGVEACAMGELTDFHVLIPFEVETVYQPVNVEDGSVEILRCAQDDEHMATVAICRSALSPPLSK